MSYPARVEGLYKYDNYYMCAKVFRILFWNLEIEYTERKWFFSIQKKSWKLLHLLNIHIHTHTHSIISFQFVWLWKSDLIDKIKSSFFQAAIISILLYGCTTWTLTKQLEKRLDGNYTRMLSAILNSTWRQHPSKQQLYGHLPPITIHTMVDMP